MGKVQGVGPKACTQCGTTRTPQWREGPLGPKTLCNACGVKRVRSMRAPQEQSARRKSTAAPRARPAPAGPGAKRAQALVTQLPPHSELLRAVERSSTGEDILEPAAAAAAPKRQRRAAAVKAASRAQEFATTGHWPSDNDEPITVPIATLSGPATSGSQHHSDDSAEEEVWGPPSGPLPLLSHPSMKMGESSSAAIGLLAMSLPEEEVKAASRSTSPSTDRAPAPPSGPHAADEAAGDATHHAAGPLGGLGQTLACAAWAQRNLPKDKSPQLTRLLRRAAAAYSTAVEAEAPVLATARLLAAKQAVLSRSLSEARDAAGELDEYIRRAAGPHKAPPS